LGKDVIERVRDRQLQGELEDAWNKTGIVVVCASGIVVGKTVPSSVQSSSAASLSTNLWILFIGGGSGDTITIVRAGSCFEAVHAAAAVDCPKSSLKIAAAVYPRNWTRTKTA
jgi:hypothetical protein